MVPQPNGAAETVKAGGVLSRGVSITGTVKFSEELVIDGEVEGSIESSGKLTIGEHASINGEVRSKSITVKGTVEGNIFATERCELQAGCTLRGDIEALIQNGSVVIITGAGAANLKALADVRFGGHNGLKSDIAPHPRGFFPWRLSDAGPCCMSLRRRRPASETLNKRRHARRASRRLPAMPIIVVNR